VKVGEFVIAREKPQTADAEFVKEAAVSRAHRCKRRVCLEWGSAAENMSTAGRPL
jgi:hypothetical protein